MTVSVRRAGEDDVALVISMIREIADHHSQGEFVMTTEGELASSGFGPDPRFGVLIAEDDGDAAGFASYTFQYSIWLGSSYMNIDDVFVRESYRGRKIGEELMLAARTVCTDSGLTKVRWEVQADNERAIRFYERLGAVYASKGIFRWDVANES